MLEPVIIVESPLTRTETTENVWVGNTSLQVRVLRVGLDQQWVDKRIIETLEAAFSAYMKELEETVRAEARSWLHDELRKLAPDAVGQLKVITEAGDATTRLAPEKIR